MRKPTAKRVIKKASRATAAKGKPISLDEVLRRLKKLPPETMDELSVITADIPDYDLRDYLNEARRRAIEGVEKPLFYQGQNIATLREYSDGLLEFLINRADAKIRAKEA